MLIEPFQCCFPSVRMAAAIDVIRSGPQRDLRRIRQDFSGAIAPTTGARAWAGARLTVRWVGPSSSPGGALGFGSHSGSGTPVGAAGEHGNALAFADLDDAVGAGCDRVVGPAGQGRRIHRTYPVGSATTWTFTPCRRCLAEWLARPSPSRSYSARVPSGNTESGALSRRTLSRPARCSDGEQADHRRGVGAVGQDEDLPGQAGLDDAVGAGGGQVVGPPRRCP